MISYLTNADFSAMTPLIQIRFLLPYSSQLFFPVATHGDFSGNGYGLVKFLLILAPTLLDLSSFLLLRSSPLDISQIPPLSMLDYDFLQELVLLRASVSIRHLLTRCDKKFVP